MLDGVELSIAMMGPTIGLLLIAAYIREGVRELKRSNDWMEQEVTELAPTQDYHFPPDKVDL
jgi:hypothetical protein